MSLVTEFEPLDLAALLRPLESTHPAGHFDEEDETYQAIDQEMVKLGGLHEGRIDWPYVDEASRQYLGNQCKHFRIAGHLMMARLRARTWRAWGESASVLAGMVEHFWESGHPKPGPTGYPAKRRMLALFLERLGEALSQLGATGFSDEHEASARHALESLQAQAGTAQLDEETLARLQRQLARKVEEVRSPIRPEPPPVSAPGQQGGQAISEQYFSTGGGLQMSNEREIRRTLLTVADFVNQEDAYDPAGYTLRRFALWGHIRAAPMAKSEQRTELHCVSADTVEAYQESLSSNVVDPVLLQRIEKSVASSPYWIRGSFLAAGVARRLEMNEVAEAIRYAAERFVRRIPLLMELRFHDGRLFVDEETRGWLSGTGDGEAGPGPAQEYGGLREELAAQLEIEGVEVVLKRLQDLQASFTAPRQRSYATVIAADLLASRGLPWLAEGLYANVGELMQGTTAAVWEPDLFEHLARHIRPHSAIEQGSKG
ncbi:type VI secretion system protein TssA [Zestomonas carbonaria]|uniref:ImpA N-terminal domain-containing protein n=1 Tax=Zestomonas carbonaria TaxID=2762745 RepID=A0A7U7EQN4_9GAMM|nr:type VI secretion system protein TssA [Pseudomonas carbonaria]CAD5109369.1 hypothetical protein PSEWESI4_03666 [Pseudomonas carbonaria]